MQHLKWISIS